jgi:hypothetical protein
MARRDCSMSKEDFLQHLRWSRAAAKSLEDMIESADGSDSADGWYDPEAVAEGAAAALHRDPPTAH